MLRTSASWVVPKRWVLAPAVLTLAVGCQPTDSARSEAQRLAAPSWARGLEEHVAPVPSGPIDDVSRLAQTPGVWRDVSGPPPRGTPQDLTRRLAAPTSEDASVDANDETPTSSVHARPWSRGGADRNTREHDDRGVVVNIQNQQPTAQAATQPAAIDPLDETSMLERLYRGSFGRDPNRKLDQFGYAFFRQPARPDQTGPVPSGYIVGPDDEITLTINGSFFLSARLPVDRDGRVTVPDIGPVTVGGRTFRELPDLFRAAIGAVRKDFELSIGMGQLRRIHVNVIGQVAQPGVTQVPAQATLLDALLVAGGPLKSGSLRKVELRRSGEKPRLVDLYEYLVDGRDEAAELLRAGDTIFVPPVGRTVGVAGFVVRPGIYELLKGTTVDDVLKLAGGTTPFTFTPQVQLERTVDGRGRETVDVKLDEAGRATSVGDGELLLVGAVDDRLQPVVRITGQVVRPGNFQYRSGMRVSDLVKAADGLTIDAYLPQAFVSRQVGGGDAVEVVPQRLTVSNARRVLVIDLRKALSGDPQHDITLSPLDLVEIVARQKATVLPTVAILGAVQNPGTYELTGGLHVSELIALAGNVTPEVYYDQAELIRRVYDARTRQLNVCRYRFDLGRALGRSSMTQPTGIDAPSDPVLRNGDQLVIRSLRQAQVAVTVEGEVRFPGKYVFPAGSRITDLISAAGGVLGEADMRAAVFTRQSVRRLQQDRLDQLAEQTRRVYEATLERMVKDGHTKEGFAAGIALEQVESLLSRMSRYQAKGRVVVPFVRNDFPDSSFNLALEDQDRLIIPRHQQTVSIVGHVFNPASFVAADKLTVGEVLKRAGGVGEQGDRTRLYVIRADGEVQSVRQQHGALKDSTPLLGGDVVLVPRKPIERSVGAQVSDVLTLTGQAAQDALLLTHLGDGTGTLDVTAVTPPPVLDGVVNYDAPIVHSTGKR